MTLVEPIPDLQWGKGSWQDYISNWRTRDTNWMQERLILRYQTSALRTTDWGATPKAGQVTYNDETKVLEMWHPTKTAWVRSLMFQYLTSNKDDSAGVQVGHTGASGKGLTFGTTTLTIDMPTTNFLSGVAVIDATGLAIKVGTKTAKLSTDATNLVSDSPVSVPGLTATTGTITTLTATTVSGITSFTTTNATLTGTLTGGILNGTSGVIGGVSLGAAAVGGTNIANASDGFQSQQGMFYGDGTSAYVQQRAVNKGALGTGQVRVTVTDVYLGGTTTFVNNQMQIRSGRGIQYLNAANSVTWYGGPVIYGADPGVAAVPEGTIWLSST